MPKTWQELYHELKRADEERVKRAGRPTAEHNLMRAAVRKFYGIPESNRLANYQFHLGCSELAMQVLLNDIERDPQHLGKMRSEVGKKLTAIAKCRRMRIQPKAKKGRPWFHKPPSGRPRQSEPSQEIPVSAQEIRREKRVLEMADKLWAIKKGRLA